MFPKLQLFVSLLIQLMTDEENNVYIEAWCRLNTEYTSITGTIVYFDHE